MSSPHVVDTTAHVSTQDTLAKPVPSTRFPTETHTHRHQHRHPTVHTITHTSSLSAIRHTQTHTHAWMQEPSPSMYRAPQRLTDTRHIHTAPKPRNTHRHTPILPLG